MKETKEKVDMFKEEICTNCKNTECDRGIVLIKYNSDELLIKCSSYIPEEREDKVNTKVEAIKYFRDEHKYER